MSRIPTVRKLKGQTPISDLNRTPTVSKIKAQIPVSDKRRTPNSMYNKCPDTSQ